MKNKIQAFPFCKTSVLKDPTMSDANSTFTGNKTYAYSAPVPLGNVGVQGYMEVQGYIKEYDKSVVHTDKVTVNSNTGVTLTNAQFLPSVLINRTGTAGGGFADTLPIAANLLLKIPNPTIGDTFTVRYFNNGTGQTSTITAPNGTVTINGTATVATATYKTLTCRVLSTDGTATPSVEVFM